VKPNASLALLLLAATLGARAHAQEAWSSAFRINAGPTLGGLKEVSQNTGYTFGLGLEVGYKLAKDTQLVGSLGYQWFPGDNKLLSFIPLSVPATGVNPSIYETRNRKLDAAGFQLGLAYRKDLVSDFYWQVGLRIGFNKASEKDTGSRVTTNGSAVANMGTTTNANILAVETIASQKDATTLSVGPTFGLGYRLGADQALTLDAAMAKISGPSAGAKTGWSLEFGFLVRF
jgi:Outer membrane protein beta-barrel domain